MAQLIGFSKMGDRQFRWVMPEPGGRFLVEEKKRDAMGSSYWAPHEIHLTDRSRFLEQVANLYSFLTQQERLGHDLIGTDEVLAYLRGQV